VVACAHCSKPLEVDVRYLPANHGTLLCVPCAEADRGSPVTIHNYPPPVIRYDDIEIDQRTYDIARPLRRNFARMTIAEREHAYKQERAWLDSRRERSPFWMMSIFDDMELEPHEQTLQSRWELGDDMFEAISRTIDDEPEDLEDVWDHPFSRRQRQSDTWLHSRRHAHDRGRRHAARLRDQGREDHRGARREGR
jgi:hypothetical protein